MEISKLKDNDIDTVIDLWYEASVKAHGFIDAKYWEKNKTAMRTQYLPASETYLAVENGDIAGFVSMLDNYLAAIFVSTQMQGQGIGTRLLNFIKDRRTLIELKVYKKNISSVGFYKRHDFEIVSENTEEETGEMEYFMKWSKE